MDLRATPEIGGVGPDTLDEALDLALLVFHETPDAALRARMREALASAERVGAYDGGTLVGLAAAFPFAFSVPGADLPGPAVSFVAVAPTHRRRGVLSGMLRALLFENAGPAAPVAWLWASEAAIYGRFGFGAASHAHTVEIDARTPLRLRTEPDPRPLRLVPAGEVLNTVGAVYERSRARRAGRFSRSAQWWEREVLNPVDAGQPGAGPPLTVVQGDPAEGYAVYRTRRTGGQGAVLVDELEAETPAVAAALWSYLASIDLASTVRAQNRPGDDVLLAAAADRDQVRVTGVEPALWARLLDVRAAMEARSWAAPVDLVLDVADAQVPANAGRFRLSAGPGGCSCTPARDRADLAVDVRDLAAAYTGGADPVHLAAAGVLAEHTPGAAAALSAALRTPFRPHAADDF
ncbi:GNAT family N-acetyltransferase [Nocardiopsis coralliicola]